ncbi:MAG: hypothetical protein KF708_08515 [Pirellulales bacterium]|nr:hypothetical protein [Pirellulales bacterium]
MEDGVGITPFFNLALDFRQGIAVRNDTCSSAIPYHPFASELRRDWIWTIRKSFLEFSDSHAHGVSSVTEF